MCNSSLHLVTTYLDYCNLFYPDVPLNSAQKLQLLENVGVRLLGQCKIRGSVLNVLKEQTIQIETFVLT